MVDHGLSPDESFTILDEKDLELPLIKQISRKERLTSFKKQLEDSKKPVKSLLIPSVNFQNEKWDPERLHDKLSKIVTELLNRSPADYENTPSAKNIRDLEQAYRFVTEKFLVSLTKYLKSIKELRQEVIRTLKHFRVISGVSAKVTLGTSIAHVFLVIAAIAKVPWHSRFSLISNIVSGLSFTASLLTISYMRQATTDVAKDIRKESRVLLDLLTAHRNGDWIDERAERLFPSGIDLNFIDKKTLETSNYFENKYSWKKYLSSSIILSNIHKDARLLDNNIFLTTVKIFVESPAAEIWWSRIKIKKLLETVSRKADSFSTKEFLAVHESHASRTALYLYPLILPWLVSSWSSEEMRFLCSIVAGVLAVRDLGNDSEEELKELKVISASFEKDFQEIEAICEILDSNDD